jgi:hypothetical protein
MAVSSKTELRFPNAGLGGHERRIIQGFEIVAKHPISEITPPSEIA